MRLNPEFVLSNVSSGRKLELDHASSCNMFDSDMDCWKPDAPNAAMLWSICNNNPKFRSPRDIVSPASISGSLEDGLRLFQALPNVKSGSKALLPCMKSVNNPKSSRFATL